MEPETNTQEQTRSPQQKSLLRKKAAIFLFFLFLSSLFWLLNSLNRDYTVRLDQPLYYINLPRNKVLWDDKDFRLSLQVQARGYDLIRAMLTQNSTPIIIDLSAENPRRLSKLGTSRAYILTSTLKESVQNQLGSDIKLLSIRPDTVYFELGNAVRKKIPVMTRLKLDFEKQYMLKGNPVVIPDSIIVSGPAILLDTMMYAYTRVHTEKKLDKSTELTVSMQPVPMVIYSQNQVKVKTSIEKYTESTIQVPIQAVNLPRGIRLKTFPHAVTVTFNVVLSDYEKISPGLFMFTVDYNDILDKKAKRLDLELVKNPEFVANLKFVPRSVEFIIEK